MLFAVGGGWIVLKLTGSLSWMFLVVGLALAIYGIGLGTTVWMRVWFRNPPSAH
jgi:disulfide bond formation protein DsbB